MYILSNNPTTDDDINSPTGLVLYNSMSVNHNKQGTGDYMTELDNAKSAILDTQYHVQYRNDQSLEWLYHNVQFCDADGTEYIRWFFNTNGKN